ncbi:techylectin-5A [Nephila pilipes]|uniref:Techylectin-5A n=1 Tax=Nephila pilipes TaxID=299642 RepID=A0A8X6MUM4_NEPPI|nr:techylectin-5A [Nephila pilipes]
MEKVLTLRKIRSSFFSLVVFLLFSEVFGKNETAECNPSQKSFSYLDAAVDLIAKAKLYFPTYEKLVVHQSKRPVDCEELLCNGHNKSGRYTIWPRSRVTGEKSLEVYCDMDTDGGGWTVIQRRGNFNRSKDYFYKDWKHYRAGFGDIEKDFWLGNDNIFALTNQRLNSIRFDLQAMEGEKRYALYDEFWIEDENRKYTLHINDYSGDAGDSMISRSNNMKFTTKDQKNDNFKDNCAIAFKGAWWYNECHDANLNGINHRGGHETFADGVNWRSWKGYHESLDTTEMKIRPKNFRKTSVLNDTPSDQANPDKNIKKTSVLNDSSSDERDSPKDSKSNPLPKDNPSEPINHSDSVWTDTPSSK